MTRAIFSSMQKTAFDFPLARADGESEPKFFKSLYPEPWTVGLTVNK